MTIVPAIAADLAPIRALLDATNLPSADIGTVQLAHFLVVRWADSDELAGVVGLEPSAPVALLRSLAVAPSRRGIGVGAAMVAAIEVLARGQGIDELVLLTMTAEHFFARLGYTVIARADAPQVLQSTREFAELCPASAVCMRKSIQL
jgi:amino-acid N-acetyltransferase